MLRFEIIEEKHSGMVANIITESFKEQAGILDISQERFPNYVAFETSEQVKNRIKQINEKIVIAYLENNPIGTIRFSIDLKDAKIGYINRLAVLPDYRGKGYGKQLMNFAEGKLTELEVKFIKIDMVAEFKKLKEYYEGLGYSEVMKKSFETLPFEVLFLKKNIPITTVKKENTYE